MHQCCIRAVSAVRRARCVLIRFPASPVNKSIHHDLTLELPDSDTAFVALRELLATHAYTEPAVCSHTGCESLYDFSMRQHARSGETPIERPLDVLVRLFMDSEPVSNERIDNLLGANARAGLASLGLLREDPLNADASVATVLMYPTTGPWIVSDRTIAIRLSTDQASTRLPEDAVYPALTASVRVFLSTLPITRDGDYLELCSGTGIAALAGAAGGASHAFAVDITERSTRFAQFNARLNALHNVTALCGDLWEPVRGRTFNTIVAHPPYVPSAQPEYIYRDGGEDGEQITRAIIAGLPDHLAVGGVFHCTCIVSSRAGQPAPQRVRAMLGAQADEYDLVFLRNGSTRITEHFSQQLMSADASKSALAAAQLKRFGELAVESVDFCTIVLRRHGKARRGFTFASERSAQTQWDSVEWALRAGEAATDTPQFATAVLNSRVRLSPGARLDMSYRVGRAGEEPWVAERGRIQVDAPFVSVVEVGTGDAMMLSRFDGTQTLQQHIAALKSEGLLPDDVNDHDFAQSFAKLVLDGVVESDAFSR